MKFHQAVKTGKTVKEKCRAIYEFLVELDTFNTINSWIDNFEINGLQSKVKEYEQVSEIVIDILDQAVEVIGDES